MCATYQSSSLSAELTTASRRHELIPRLQCLQEEAGYLSREVLEQLAFELELPLSKIYGVATFYNQFRFQPKGRFPIAVCRGTACHVKGSAAVLQALRRELKIEPGETTRDGLFSLEVVACIGACGLAPVIAIGDEFHGGLKGEEVPALIRSYRKLAGEEVAA